jgi:hypothetical protein
MTAKKSNTTKKPAAKKAARKAAPAKADRACHATARLAAQAAKDTPKSAVMRTASGFYTGSKRAGLKAGAEFIGRVVMVLSAKAKTA